MVVGRSCFSGARTFAELELIRNLAPINLDPEGSPINVDFNSEAAVSAESDLAASCWSYCCLWVQKAQANKRLVVNDWASAQTRNTLPASATSKALILALGGRLTDMGRTLVVLLSKGAIKICLDAYAAQGGSFVMLTLTHSGWAHAIAIKLNRQATGTNSGWGLPCAIFDPNVGQGVYRNHEDLAADLLSLIQAYGMLSSIRVQVVG